MGIGELSGKPDDIPCNGLVSHEGGGGGSSDTPSRLCYGKQDYH